MAGSRKPRPITYVPNEAKLTEALRTQARLRGRPYEWSGSHYGKKKRSLGPDRKALELGAELLTILINFAPSGFMSQPPLVRVLSSLDAEYGIFELPTANRLPKEIEQQRQITASDAADLWRLQMKHVVGMRRSLESSSCQVLQACLDRLPAPSDIGTDTETEYEPPVAAEFEIPRDSTGAPDSRSIETVSFDGIDG